MNSPCLDLRSLSAPVRKLVMRQISEAKRNIDKKNYKNCSDYLIDRLGETAACNYFFPILEHYYQSEQVESQGFHLGTGMTWGIFEILIRRSSLDYQYNGLERQGSVKLGKDLKVKSVVWSLGLGLSF